GAPQKHHYTLNQQVGSITLDVYNLALATARNHPLTTRRYMWKVEY
ncbi:hypothetical protein ACR96H_23595, partial [Klebsiella pneumoniae]